ncbi:MAG TPA: inositol monophosphatase family protein [Candidatus Pacearchaeota archaeon]|nr:inositol monophosphatase family protein [Candidatus Pacearchaeota archaeon]HOK94083.1 inositol monophosphatase family protein [Candidatus Pacearchaeota archaeon]HPO75154.1 inositol monophosphatase family protein [Candidatus Pacearchaeota archaeon]
MGKLSFSKKRDILFALEKIVRKTGEDILTQRGAKIFDTLDYKGHESSVIDNFARERMQAAIDSYLPELEGIVRFELRPFTKTLLETEEHQNLVLIIDEIEGTTNAKRCLAAAFEYQPLAIVSTALSLSENLKDLILSAIYTLDQGEVFSAINISDNDFLAFHNNRIISPSSIVLTQGDSRKRILVVGYSNSHRLQKGEVEQALYDKKLKVYDGCRASGMDIINLIRNSVDAYIDLRHYWSTKDEKGEEKEAMLQIYDVAGVIPIAEGCGLKVTDAEGKSWREYNLNDTIPLVISRPDIHQLILDTIKPFIEKWKGEKEK